MQLWPLLTSACWASEARPQAPGSAMAEKRGEPQPCPRTLWAAHICSWVQAEGPAGRSLTLGLDAHFPRNFRGLASSLRVSVPSLVE